MIDWIIMCMNKQFSSVGHLGSVYFLRVRIAFEKLVWITRLHDQSKRNYYQELLLELYLGLVTLVDSGVINK